MPWIEMDNPAKELVRSDLLQAANLGFDALGAVFPVRKHLDSAWMGNTPARDEFAAGLEDQREIVLSVCGDVQTALGDTYKAEPEKILERVY